MPYSSTSVTLRCTDCGSLLAEYHGVTLHGGSRTRLQAHAHDVLAWHLSKARDCAASEPRLAQVVRHSHKRTPTPRTPAKPARGSGPAHHPRDSSSS
jgi:hypothetical protein